LYFYLRLQVYENVVSPSLCQVLGQVTSYLDLKADAGQEEAYPVGGGGCTL